MTRAVKIIERRMTDLPYLLPWLKVHLVIRQIRSRTWDSAAWPVMKEALRDALRLRSQMQQRRGWRS